MKIKTRSIEEKYIWAGLFCLIGLLAVIRMFWNIGGDYFTFLDEYPTFDVAAGFMHTGKLKFWDFHHGILSEESYTRAWPHTLILAGWFRIFGINVVAGKMLSAFFGVLFVLSLFYITKQIYDNYYISVLACLFVMTNSTVITVFRQIRMYSLWLLCMVWLMYFIFRMMTVTPEPMAMEGKSGVWGSVCRWWYRNLNFSVGYILLSVFSFFLTYFVQVNTLAIGAGMCLFYLYLLAVKRERRYYTALVFIVCIVVAGILALLLLPHYSGAFEEADLWSVITDNISLREEINERYWMWTKDFVHNRTLFWGTAVSVIPALLKGIRKKNEKETIAYEFSIYMLLVLVSTLGCFLYLLSRYYQARYMIYAAPVIAVLMAWGIFETCSLIAGIVGRNWRRFSLCVCPSVSLLCICALSVSVAQQYTEVYENESICYHRQVYEIVERDAQERFGNVTVPIVAFDFRDYYAVQVFSDYEDAKLDRENDAQIWQDFGRKHPDGYMLVESAKINGFPEVTKRFIQDYSERIAGDGLDSYNIEAVRYHFLDAEQKEAADEMDSLISYECIKEGKGSSLLIRLDTGKLADGAEIVFLNFDGIRSDQSTERFSYQLRLSQQEEDGIYTYKVSLPEGFGSALLENGIMIYYKDGTVTEL